MSDRTENPTESKLEALRAEGLVPFSRCTVSGVSAAVLLISIFALKGEFLKVIDSIKDLYRTIPESYLTSLSVIFRKVVPLVMVPAVGVVIASLMVGLLQTRFLILFSRMAPDLSRLQPGAHHIFSIVGRVIAGLLSTALALGIGAGTIFLLGSDLLAPLNSSRQGLAGMFWAGFDRLLPVLVFALVGLSVISWFTARFRFFRAHRMTREEVRREARER